MGDPSEMAAAFEAALQSGDFARVSALVQEYATDDFVQEWPQSGERMTKAAAVRMAEQYPAMSGTSPKMTYKRMLGSADLFVVEGTIDYGDGRPGRVRRDRRAAGRQGRADDRVLRQPVRGAGLAGGLHRAHGARHGLTGLVDQRIPWRARCAASRSCASAISGITTSRYGRRGRVEDRDPELGRVGGVGEERVERRVVGRRG